MQIDERYRAAMNLLTGNCKPVHYAFVIGSVCFASSQLFRLHCRNAIMHSAHWSHPNPMRVTTAVESGLSILPSVVNVSKYFLSHISTHVPNR